MDVLQVWAPSIVAGIVAVVVAAAFTWAFNERTERRRCQGVRALLSSEITHNKTVLKWLRADLVRRMQESDLLTAAMAFRATAKSLQWQRARWDLPDVGVAVPPADLRGLTRWYFSLDQVTYAYDQLIRYLADLDPRDPRILDAQSGAERSTVTADVLDAMKYVMGAMDEAIDSIPPLPDKRLYIDSGNAENADGAARPTPPR